MAWLAARAAERAAPTALWPLARSAVVVALSYAPDGDALAGLSQPCTGNVSVYARGRDYHEVLKGRLKRLAADIARLYGAEMKVFVDTAAVMEKPLAQRAGLGWQGKHTNLVSRALGSWFFLGVVMTDLDLVPDASETDHCGQCQACLDICPTRAFPAPYVLDARRCISYLTIEHKGHIDRALRPLMGNRIFGCDDCLAACPWNKFARAATDAAWRPREMAAGADLARLARLDDAAYRRAFAGTPVRRTGRDRLVRNVLIAIGNSGACALAPEAERLLDDASPVVRAAAVWASRRLRGEESLAPHRARHLAVERDETVRAEWDGPL
jgi:epoxyqueuosine reductase